MGKTSTCFERGKGGRISRSFSNSSDSCCCRTHGMTCINDSWNDLDMAIVKPSRSLPKIFVNESPGQEIRTRPVFLSPKCGRNLRTAVHKHRSCLWP